MNKIRLKIISVFLCLTLLFTYQVGPVLAAENIAKHFNNLNNVLAAKITDDQFKVIVDNDEVCTVVGVYEGDELHVTINKLTDEITMQSIEKSPLDKVTGLSLGKNTIHNYTVNVENAINGEISATATDIAAKKMHKISQNSNKVKAQIAIVVPLVDILGAALLAFIIAYVGYIIVQGIKCVPVSEMYDKIKDNPSAYYAAYTVPRDNVYIAGQISYNTAVERMLMPGNSNPYCDVFTALRTNAAKVARAASSNQQNPAPWPDGEIGSSEYGEQYWHYHVWGRATKSHSFFILFK